MICELCNMVDAKYKEKTKGTPLYVCEQCSKDLWTYIPKKKSFWENVLSFLEIFYKEDYYEGDYYD